MQKKATFLFFTLLVALFFVAASYYLEFVEDLRPCLLCFFQRWLLILFAVLAIFALFTPFLLRRIFLIINVFTALLGSVFAIRQIWLQHQPPSQVISCLPDTAYLVKHVPLPSLVKMAFQGTPDCGVVHERIIFLSLSEWSLLGFVVLLIMTLLAFKRSK
ncbi:MAG: hypothetical protein COV52_05585 [Gammaproteobacteria bacterium CG11_big_fil_rev_8_21_14_0_20_46_22]|nr:MAG: hypothetical protein COW05_08075 [Gammaproteobacteria bacterium CG12_big_fil_rev_8_21_14_0_65_46_12]PIR10977.1 MAG: hypothetical protein COV52_05585 [Gammaproteobacteria bacterium CG11_big_fil_rev_8_21_14_0_20_46_22]